MTQRSRFWDGAETGDAVLAPYDAATEFSTVLQSLAGFGLPGGGVFRGELNELAVTGAGSPVSVASGRAMVCGSWYENDAPVSIEVASQVGGTRHDLVVLRKIWTAQTVRLALVQGTPGGAVPTPQQILGDTWEIPIAELLIQGTAITVTDRRRFDAALSHDDLVDVSPDDHHPQSHTHDGSDGSGSVDHGDLTGVTADQHHAKAHNHTVADGTGTVQHKDLGGLDTNLAATSLHHTLGSGATQAAPGNHVHGDGELLSSHTQLADVLPDQHHTQLHNIFDETHHGDVAPNQVPQDGDVPVFDGLTGQWTSQPAPSSGHVIENEGTPLTQRSNMNFVGDAVNVTDAGGKTVVTINVPRLTAEGLPAGQERGQVLKADEAGNLYWSWMDYNLQAIFQGDPIPNLLDIVMKLDDNFKIMQWDLYADQACNAQFDVQVSTFEDYPVFNTICGGQLPELVNAAKSQQPIESLTLWRELEGIRGYLQAGTIVRMLCVSNDVATRITFSLKIRRTD
jgi:hypothetical protein